MSGISVINATYGTTSTTADVTKAVSSSIKDGVLNLTVTPTALNVTDPAPGQAKILNISYTINGGQTLKQSINDNETLYVNAPPSRIASGLQIVNGDYGVEGNFTDVTDVLKGMIKKGGINLKVGFKALGLPDPNPNKQKELQVEYTINGAKSKNIFKDGETFSIDAPPVDKPSNTTPTQMVNSVIGMLFSNVARFFGIFLFSFSLFSCVRFGSMEGRNMIFWGALGFIPYFGFWGLPLIVLVLSMFYGDTIVIT
jgi:hypothetical protein